MSTVNEDKIKQSIDFTVSKSGKLDESSLQQMGARLGWAISQMMAGAAPALSITGTPDQIEILSRTLGLEKNYVQALVTYGGAHPTSQNLKTLTDKAAKEFYIKTGVPWPFS